MVPDQYYQYLVLRSVTFKWSVTDLSDSQTGESESDRCLTSRVTTVPE